MLPKKGSRPINVDGTPYRWRLRRKPTKAQRDGAGVVVAIAHATRPGQTLLLALGRAHAHNNVDVYGVRVQPSHVAAWIRGARGAGWMPGEPGPPFRTDERFGTHPGRAYAPFRAPRTQEDAPQIAQDWPRTQITRRGQELFLDGEPFMERLRRAEQPHTDRERSERGGVGPEAAEYDGQMLLPLGPTETDHGFALPADDPRRRKPALMGCSCGVFECWMLLCDVWVLEDVVIWANFEQFHRPWIYTLGPFAFDKAQYTALG